MARQLGGRQAYACPHDYQLGLELRVRFLGEIVGREEGDECRAYFPARPAHGHQFFDQDFKTGRKRFLAVDLPV